MGLLGEDDRAAVAGIRAQPQNDAGQQRPQGGPGGAAGAADAIFEQIVGVRFAGRRERDIGADLAGLCCLQSGPFSLACPKPDEDDVSISVRCRCRLR